MSKVSSRGDLPSARNDVSVAAFDREFDVHGKVGETVDLESFANCAEHEEDLHLDSLAVGSNGPGDVMEETKVAGSYVSYVWIAVYCPAAESFSIKRLFAQIE